MKATLRNNRDGRTAFVLMTAALMLQACGGGGGDSIPAPGTGSAATVLSGVVIYDAPVRQAKVEIRDAEGHTWATDADASGHYQIAIPAGSKLVPPVLVKASGTGNRWEVGNGVTLASSVIAGTYTAAMVPSAVDAAKSLAVPVQLYAVASAPSTIHVTPATSLVVERLTGHRAEGAMQNLGKPGTTIAAALSAEKIAAAGTAVKQTLGEIGLPATLVDDPASPSLVPVNLTSTYQKLVTGDILSAAGNLLNAIVDNQIDFGCNGEGYGIMPDDGVKRPSCLAGANAGHGWRLTPFMALESRRSLNIETRAQELAGVNGPGGGWKFQSERFAAPVLRSRLQKKIMPVLQRATGIQPTTTAADALSALRSLSGSDWDRLNETVCASVSVSELSDLTHSYQQLKLEMKPYIVTPTEDAAEPLLISGFPIKSTAINRVIPIGFDDGSRVSSCPVFSKQGEKFRNLAAGYSVGAGRPSLSEMLVQFDSGLTAWLAYPLDQRTSDPALLVLLFTPTVLIDGTFPSGPFDFSNQSSALFRFMNSEATCAVYGEESEKCRTNLFTAAQLRSAAAVWAASVPPDLAAGTIGEDSDSLLARLSGDIAQVVMDEYEQRFDIYFNSLAGFAPTAFKVLEAQGYVVYQWQRSNPQYAASVAIPDVSKLGYRVNGSSLELVGQFVAKRVDSVIPAFETETTLFDPFLIVPVNVVPEQLPGIAMCETADLACMGRLRRSRLSMPMELVHEVSGTGSVAFATSSFWQNYLNLPLQRAETLSFDHGYAETSLSIKAK